MVDCPLHQRVNIHKGIIMLQPKCNICYALPSNLSNVGNELAASDNFSSFPKQSCNHCNFVQQLVSCAKVRK